MSSQTLNRTRTRDEYIRRRNVSHHDYFTQFVTEQTLGHVHAAFSTQTLREALAQDEHLNSIPLRRWYLLAIRELEPAQRGRLNPSGSFTATIPFDRLAATLAGETITRSTLVCIAKCAARILVARENGTT